MEDILEEKPSPLEGSVLGSEEQSPSPVKEETPASGDIAADVKKLSSWRQVLISASIISCQGVQVCQD